MGQLIIRNPQKGIDKCEDYVYCVNINFYLSRRLSKEHGYRSKYHS